MNVVFLNTDFNVDFALKQAENRRALIQFQFQLQKRIYLTKSLTTRFQYRIIIHMKGAHMRFGFD